MHFGSYWAKYWHFWPISSLARPKNNVNNVPRCFFRYVFFLPQNDQIWPKIGLSDHFGPGLAGSFGALLVGCLVVVARGLYLARHLFTLFVDPTKAYLIFDILTLSIVGLWIISRGSEKKLKSSF